MTIGQKIKELRIQKSMTQKELANILNISQQALSHYEMGDRDISLELLKKICVIFDITSDELLEIETREERNKIISNNTINLKNSNNNNINF